MTDLPDRSCAALAVEAVEVAPGEPADAVVSVTNRRAVPCRFALTVIGLEPGWVRLPATVGPLAPGERADVPLRVTLPAGHPPASLLAMVEARPLPPADAAGWTAADDGERREPAGVDLRVVVGDGAVVAARVEPGEVRGGARGRFAVVLRNRSTQTQRVALTAVTPDPAVALRFDPRSPLLLPGQELRVDGRIRAHRPLAGEPRRRPFGVRVQGRGTPVSVEGSFTSHPVVPRWAAKALTIVVVLALWVAVAALGISALSSHLHHSTTVGAASASPTAAQGHARAGSGHGASSGTSGHGTGSSGGSGSSSGAAGGAGAGSSAAGAGPTIEVAGRVSGASPAGVQVSLAPTSLVDPSALEATAAPSGGAVTTAAVRRVGGGTPSATGRPTTDAAVDTDGKVYGTAASATFFPGLAASAAPTVTTVTAPDGSYVFTGVPAPGTYLLTFSKAGYTTRRYIVQASQSGQAVTLDTVLTSGTGSLSGQTMGPSGPLGGVSVTVSDGTDTVTTVTPTTGPDVGSWSVSGLNTPDSYLVTATAAGYGTQTTTVSLPASGSVAGVDLDLRSGVGAITGTVVSAASGQPVGGVMVTATDGSTTVTATTSTVAPVGAYSLPNLAIPATWTVSVSGSGWITQTQQVDLTGNSTVNASLTASGANVTGVVSSSSGGGLANVGLTLANQTNTFKTLSESVTPTGGFDFGQVPPGQYVLTATAYGYTTESAQVDVGAGQTQTIDLSLPFVGQGNIDTATITGSVQNLFAGTPLAGVAIDLDGQATAAVTNAQGSYTLTDVGPGLHTVTAEGESLGFADGSVQVSVSQGATVVAPLLALAELDTLTGTVLSAATGEPVPSPQVSLMQGGQTVGAPVEATSTATGSYKVTNIPAGTYVLQVSAPGYETTDISISLGVDQNLTETVSLDLGPSFSVLTFADSGTGFVPVAGVCVTVTNLTDASQAPTTQLSTGSTALQFTGLESGDDYDATFAEPPSGVSCANDTSPVATAPAHDFVGTPNNTSVYSAFLAPTLGGLTVALTFPYVEAGTGSTGITVDCPVTTTQTAGSSCPDVDTLPTVTVTGTTSYTVEPNGSIGTAETATVAASPPSAAGSGDWTLSPTTLAEFISTSVTLKVTGGPFATLAPSTPITLSTGASSNETVDELLTPVPVPVSGILSPSSGVTITVTPSVLAPSGTPGAANTLSAIDDITATEGAGGELQWSDPATGGPGYAQPGSYSMTLAAPGYDGSGPVTVDVGLCQAGCRTTVSPPALNAQVDLTIAPQVPAPGFSGLTLPAAPTATLSYDGTAVSTESIGTSGSVTFPTPLSPAQAAAAATAGGAGYTWSVSGPGIQSVGGSVSVADLDAASSGGGSPPTLTENPSLTLEGILTGTVDGIIVPGATGTGASQDLSGATVTATLDTTDTPAGLCPTTGTGAYSATLTATTDTSGDFTVVGDPSSGNGGLCVGGVYDLTVSQSGYTTGAAVPQTVTVTGTDNVDAVGTLDIDATPVTQVIDVEVADAGVAVTVSATSPLGPTVTDTVDASLSGSVDVAAFSFSLDPTSYSFSLSAPQYESITLGPEPYQPGSVPSTITYQLPEELSTVEGAVTIATGTSTTAPVAGLPLSLVPAAGSGSTAITTTTTGSDGSFTFPVKVPNGNYDIDVGDGYTTSAPVTFSTDYPLAVDEDFSVEAASTPVTVTLGTTAPDLSGSGLTVTLTPAAATPTAVDDACTTGTGAQVLLEAGLGATETATAALSGGKVTALFSDLVPDAYTVGVAVDGSADDQFQAPTSPTELVVCPGGSTSPAPPDLVAQVGEISGTVTAPSGASQVTVTATPTSGATPSDTFSTSCVPATTTCTYTLYTALATAYTVTAAATGYTTADDAANPVTLLSASPSATFSPSLVPGPETASVSVTVTPSTAALDDAADGATVKLTPTSGSGTSSYTQDTDAADTATFSAVTGGTTYDVSVTPDLPGATEESDVTTVTVGLTSASTSVALQTGTVSGTVTLQGTAPTSDVPVTVTVQGSAGADTCDTETVDAGDSSTTWSCTLPPGSYTPSFAATGYTTTPAGSAVTVTDGGSTTGVDVSLPT